MEWNTYIIFCIASITAHRCSSRQYMMRRTAPCLGKNLIDSVVILYSMLLLGLGLTVRYSAVGVPLPWVNRKRAVVVHCFVSFDVIAVEVASVVVFWEIGQCKAGT